MVFVEHKILVGDNALAEILMAELGEVGDISFEVTESGDATYLSAYASAELFRESEAVITSIYERYAIEHVERREIADQNWNAAWESSYPPCDVANCRVRIRSPYHEPSPSAELDIVISPRMSFGTGHHPTTAMMVEYLIEDGVASQRLLDVGCGTGILSIAAVGCGATGVDAVEIDEGAYCNAMENFALNGIAERVRIFCGSIEQVEGSMYDIILANIHLNIISQQMPLYAASLNGLGRIYVSGFYEEDLERLAEVAAESALCIAAIKRCDGWVAVRLERQ